MLTFKTLNELTSGELVVCFKKPLVYMSHSMSTCFTTPLSYQMMIHLIDPDNKEDVSVGLAKFCDDFNMYEGNS